MFKHCPADSLEPLHEHILTSLTQEMEEERVAKNKEQSRPPVILGTQKAEAGGS